MHSNLQLEGRRQKPAGITVLVSGNRKEKENNKKRIVLRQKTLKGQIEYKENMLEVKNGESVKKASLKVL